MLFYIHMCNTIYYLWPTKLWIYTGTKPLTMFLHRCRFVVILLHLFLCVIKQTKNVTLLVFWCFQQNKEAGSQQQKGARDGDNERNYAMTVKENAAFEAYYKVNDNSV